jgi:hypothetical protein
LTASARELEGNGLLARNLENTPKEASRLPGDGRRAMSQGSEEKDPYVFQDRRRYGP